MLAIITRSMVGQASSPARVVARCSSIKRAYATSPGTPKPSSSHTPWILAGVALTGVGTYVALSPQGKAQAHNAKEHAKTKAHETKEAVESKTEEARERERKRDEERAPKPNPNADSAKRHEGHAELNEHRVRTGKFSDVQFDNHDTSHSTDPGKDFEVQKPASK